MTGKILQINLSLGGLPKRPVQRAMLTPLGLEGDSWAGEPDKAVLLMDAESIDELAAGGYPVFYGAMGENLTTQGLDRRQWRPGQQLRVGRAAIELTTESSATEWGVSGIYARVIRPGLIEANRQIAWTGSDGDRRCHDGRSINLQIRLRFDRTGRSLGCQRRRSSRSCSSLSSFPIRDHPAVT